MSVRAMAATELVTIDPHAIDVALLAQAAACLREGGIAAFPTETVYGVGVRADDPAALARLAAVKGRQPDKPFAILVADIAGARALVGALPATAERLMRHFWPGPLTVVVSIPPPAKPAFGRERDRRSGPLRGPLAGGRTIGLRCPDHPIARAFMRAAGVPIAASSANRSGAADARTAAEVVAALSGVVDFIVDGGPCREGRPSTVVEVTDDRVQILREGAIAKTAIVALVG